MALILVRSSQLALDRSGASTPSHSASTSSTSPSSHPSSSSHSPSSPQSSQFPSIPLEFACRLLLPVASRWLPVASRRRRPRTESRRLNWPRHLGFLMTGMWRQTSRQVSPPSSISSTCRQTIVQTTNQPIHLLPEEEHLFQHVRMEHIVRLEDDLTYPETRKLFQTEGTAVQFGREYSKTGRKLCKSGVVLV